MEARGTSLHSSAMSGLVLPTALQSETSSRLHRRTPIVEVAARVDHGAGVLFVYGNYDGDVMNFEMAEELLADRGVRAMHVAVTDDVASAPLASRTHRRGVAGDYSFSRPPARGRTRAQHSRKFVPQQRTRTTEHERSVLHSPHARSPPRGGRRLISPKARWTLAWSTRRSRARPARAGVRGRGCG